MLYYIARCLICRITRIADKISFKREINGFGRKVNIDSPLRIVIWVFQGYSNNSEFFKGSRKPVSNPKSIEGKQRTRNRWRKKQNFSQTKEPKNTKKDKPENKECRWGETFSKAALNLKGRRLPTLPLYAVPSARTGLTSLFGMGRGGTPTL